MTRVAVIGAGAWGSALACVARRAGNETILWARDPALAAAINESRENARYLPGIPLTDGVTATTDLAMAARDADLLLLAIPAQHLRAVTASMTPLPVFGVPIQSKSLNGLDSLLSIVQMPAGVPVGATAIGRAGAVNAALLAAAVLALSDTKIATALDKYRAAQTRAVPTRPN